MRDGFTLVIQLFLNLIM